MKKVLTALSMLVLLTGCNFHIDGGKSVVCKGEEETRNMDLSGFDKILINGQPCQRERGWPRMVCEHAGKPCEKRGDCE